MRSYRINTDRLVNQLVPHYLGGRKLILLIQSLLQPLNSLNKTWKEKADDMRIEAAMTSQVIMLEWFLNRKYKKYFADQSKHIVISDGSVNGVPLYWEGNSSIGISSFPVYNEGESEVSGHESQPLRWKDEKQAESEVSFTVNCPTIDTKKITQAEVSGMIAYWVNRYRIAGKKFNVTFS